MIDHVAIAVANLERSRKFFEAALAPLGYSVVGEWDGQLGFGRDGKPDFFLYQSSNTTRPIHLAFRAKTRAEVDAFHRAALAAGADDNGAPGLRPHYHATYYAAFVLDHESRNVEAVCYAAD